MEMTTHYATHSTRLANGSWFHHRIPDRTTVRHGWAETIENYNRDILHDGAPAPGGGTVLEWVLRGFKPREVR